MDRPTVIHSAMRAVENAYLATLAANDALHSAVVRARAQAATWEEIGNTLGITRQAAHQRFGSGR